MFEVFNTSTARGMFLVPTEKEAFDLTEAFKGTDYEQAAPGYYIKRDDKVTWERFDLEAKAKQYCDMANLASDYATYTVFPYFPS